MCFPLALVFLLACGVAWLTAPLVERAARHYGFMDRPNPRRDPILKPRLGGVALYTAFVAALAASTLVVPRDAAEIQRVTGMVLGGGLVLAMGAADDRFELPALPQLAVQVLAALVAMGSGILITFVTNPFGDPVTNSMIELPLWVAAGFTLFWIVGALNTINFIDGLDGLAVGVGGVAAAVLGLHSLMIGQYSIAVLAAALAGACLGFLPHNCSPARITMGSSGSAFLGFALATLAIVGGAKTATLLLVLGVPITDTAWAILRRVAARRSPFSGDRGHLHHVLLDLGWKPAQIVLFMYAACGSLGLVALLVTSRLGKLLTIGGLVVLLIAALAVMAQARNRNRQSTASPSHGSIDRPHSM